MIRSEGPLRALPDAQLVFDEHGLPRSERYGDHYASREDGAAETRHVFLEGCELDALLAQPSRRLLTVGELGFGTGLNFLSTWSLLREAASPGKRAPRLHYWSVDAHPLRRDDLRRALQRWPQFSSLAGELIEHFPPPVRGVHRRVFDDGRVTLDCVWAEARAALEDLADTQVPVVDAWFLDGFAPSRNEAMWEESLFPLVAAASRPGATLGSYTAAGAVRRGLERAGFAVRKRPGFGSKRECIAATLTGSAPERAPRQTPWDRATHRGEPGDIVVLGAGLGGAHVAAALARRGYPVTVCESGDVAAGASGNAQGVLFSRLSHRHSQLSDFSLLAQGFAANLYRQMLRRGQLEEGTDGELHGCLQLPGPRSDLQRLAEALEELPEIARLVAPQESEPLLGAAVRDAGFWQPDAGWLSPPAVCRALLDHPVIELQSGCGKLRVLRDGGQWVLLRPDGREHRRCKTLVLATASDTTTLLDTLHWLPLQLVRGQTTSMPAASLPRLRAPLCHDGYIAPARNGTHCIGATFAPHDSSTEVRGEDNRENLDRLKAALPGWEAALAELDGSSIAGRAALRTSTVDYLPLVGPVPDRDAFLARYAPLAADARAIVPEPAPCMEGLFISTAFGSRGLSYAAMAGEVMAAQITRETPPLSRELQRALSPARFLLRDLVRGKAGPAAAHRTEGAAG